MAFTLNIETSNEAFTADPGAEIARIMRLVADSLALSDIPLNGDERRPVRDINGSIVGRWEYTPEWPQWECPRCHTINADVSAEPGDVTCVDCSLTVSASEVLA